MFVGEILIESSEGLHFLIRMMGNNDRRERVAVLLLPSVVICCLFSWIRVLGLVVFFVCTSGVSLDCVYFFMMTSRDSKNKENR